MAMIMWFHTLRLNIDSNSSAKPLKFAIVFRLARRSSCSFNQLLGGGSYTVTDMGRRKGNSFPWKYHGKQVAALLALHQKLMNS